MGLRIHDKDPRSVEFEAYCNMARRDATVETLASEAEVHIQGCHKKSLAQTVKQS